MFVRKSSPFVSKYLKYIGNVTYYRRFITIFAAQKRRQFPYADFCVYSANVITPLLHDMMPNNTLYVETNRDTTQSVFDMLFPKYKGRLFLAPTKEVATTYIDFSKENIIVKPLVTEAPLTLDGKMPVPTLITM